MLNAERITKSLACDADQRYDTKVKYPTVLASFWVKNSPLWGAKLQSNARGMPGRNAGCLWNWLVHSGSMVIGHRADIQLENTVSDIPISWQNLCITNAILRLHAGIGKTMSGTEPRHNLLQPDNQQLPQSLAVYPLNHDRSFRVKQVNQPSENPS